MNEALKGPLTKNKNKKNNKTNNKFGFDGFVEVSEGLGGVRGASRGLPG